MNRLRLILFGSVVILIVISIVIIGINAETKTKDSLLKSSDVIQSFSKEEIKLEISNEFSASSFTMDQKQPMIYSFPESDETLFVYEFPSIGSRKSAEAELLEGGFQQIQGFNNLKTAGNHLMTTLVAKNVLLIYTVKYDAERAKEINKPVEMEEFINLYAPNISKIKEITFKDLNNGVTLKYYGKAQHWEGKADLSYYQYFWKDENGNESYESWNNVDLYLRYLGEEKELLKEVITIYDGPTGFGQGVFNYYDQSFDKDGFVRLGTSGEKNYVNTDNLSYIISIQWHEGKETLVLEPIND